MANISDTLDAYVCNKRNLRVAWRQVIIVYAYNMADVFDLSFKKMI